MTLIKDNKEIKKLLKLSLKKFDEICKENNLKYSIAFGTLLGAVRHKGFIPWDDDIDVAMPREDYEKLLALKYNDGRYEIKSARYCKNYFYTFAKLSDNKTFIKEPNRDGQELGLYVDIFPFDYVSEKYFNENYDKLNKKVINLPNYYGVFGVNTNTPNSELSFSKIIKKYAHKAILPISAQVLTAFEKHSIAPKAEYCVLFQHNFSGLKTSFKSTEWDNLIPMQFEDITVMGFANYDEILTNTYGDYMTPPKNVTQTHDYKAYYR